MYTIIEGINAISSKKLSEMGNQLTTNRFKQVFRCQNFGRDGHGFEGQEKIKLIT